MSRASVKGRHKITIRDKKGKPSEAVLAIKYEKTQVLPPIGKQKKHLPLLLTVIHAQEKGQPKTRDKISWKLITNLQINSKRKAVKC